MIARADDPDKWPRPIWYVEDDGKVFRIVYFPYREQVPPAKVPDPGDTVKKICKNCPHYEVGQRKFLAENVLKKMFDGDALDAIGILSSIIEYAGSVKRLQTGEEQIASVKRVGEPGKIRLANETEISLYAPGGTRGTEVAGEKAASEVGEALARV